MLLPFLMLPILVMPLLVTPAFAAAPVTGNKGPAPAPGVPVVMVPRPGTPLDQTARSLVATDLARSARAGDRPLLLVGSAKLGEPKPGPDAERPAIFIQLQSPRECGSGGCSTSVYAWINGRYQRVLDDVSGRLAVAATRHRGMADLVADDQHYVWTGTAYANTKPAPNIDLRPTPPHPTPPHPGQPRPTQARPPARH